MYLNDFYKYHSIHHAQVSASVICNYRGAAQRFISFSPTSELVMLQTVSGVRFKRSQPQVCQCVFLILELPKTARLTFRTVL